MLDGLEGSGTVITPIIPNIEDLENKNQESKKIFDNISIFYEFNRKDYKSYPGKKPWIRWKSWKPDSYSEFLYAGTLSRVNITRNVLGILKEEFEVEPYFLNTLGFENDIVNEVLSFSNVPFKNAPKNTPSSQEMSSISQQRKFDIYDSGFKKIADIEYILPTRDMHQGYYSGTYSLFDKGGVKVEILGSEITHEDQFARLAEKLNHLRWR